MQARVQGFADEQLEGAFGGFEFIALEFEVLDAFEELAAGFFAEAVGDAMLLELVKDIGPAREVA